MPAPAIVMDDKIMGECPIHMIPNPARDVREQAGGDRAVDMYMLRDTGELGPDRHRRDDRMRREA